MTMDERHRWALTRILRNGGLVTLGTEAARGAWFDGISEAAALIGAHFTPEELDTIAAGADAPEKDTRDGDQPPAGESTPDEPEEGTTRAEELAENGTWSPGHFAPSAASIRAAATIYATLRDPSGVTYLSGDDTEEGQQ